jgi:hypothetical protein
MAKKKTKKQTPLEIVEAQWETAKNSNIGNPVELEDGIHYDIPFEQYVRIDAVNNSRLKLMDLSPAHFKWGTYREETKAFMLGSFIHSAKLEPELLDQYYWVIPDAEILKAMKRSGEHLNEAASRKAGKPVEYTNLRATKAYKTRVQNLKKKNDNKQEVSEDWYRDTRGILAKINANSKAKTSFTLGKAEVTIIWTDPETGIRCKGRLDFLRHVRKIYKITDLKTTIDMPWFSVQKFDYHAQAGMYSTGVAELLDLSYIPEFHFTVAEKQKPYGVKSAPLSENLMRQGIGIFRNRLLRLAECLSTDKWPSYSNPSEWEN